MRFPWQKYDSDLARELAHHLAELTDEFIRQGYSPEEARQLAKRHFGGPDQIKEQCRDESPWAWLSTLTQDLRFGIRQLHQAPVVTAAAVLSLALGIGGNSAIFSLMDSILWRTLPVSAPEQLNLLLWQGPGFPDHLADGAAGGMHKDGAARVADFFPYAAIENFKKAAAGRAQVAPYSFSNASSLSFSGRPTIAQHRAVGGNFFNTLQVPAAIGRTLRDSDDQVNAPAVAVITHRFFSDFFSSDPSTIGQSLRIDNRPYEIIGVLPASFSGISPGDGTKVYSALWKSSSFAIPNQGKVSFADSRFWCIQALMRRAPGITAETLRPSLSAAFQQSWQPKEGSAPKTKDPQLRLDEGSRGLGDMSRSFREPLFFLSALLALVLLIACANIANLLLARASVRAKEVALRMSLGCTQGRLLRQFLTESALLAILGGLASIVVAYASAQALAPFLTGRNATEPLRFSVDFPMLSAIAAISMLTLLLFGLFPAWRASRQDSNMALKEGSGSLGSAARHWCTPGRLLIIGQMSLALILVTAAVLFTENLRGLSSRDTGFDRTNLLIFGLRPGTSGYDFTRLPAFYQELERRLNATPGVELASLAAFRPMNQGGWWEDIKEVGQSKNHHVAANLVTPSYLPVFVPTLKAGRHFNNNDLAPNAARVAIISEDLARAISPGASPIGKRIHFDERNKVNPMEVVGVTPPMAFNSMKDRPQVVWIPFDPKAEEATVVLRTKSSPRAILPAIQATLADIDRNLPLIEVFTMEEQMSKNLQRERMFATLCSTFGILAILLSVIGLYGVMSYNASRRRNEIGVRLALGAEPHNVVWMVLKEAIALTLLGLTLAAPAIYFGSRFLEKELFELKPLNPLLLFVSVLLLATAAILAAWVPAHRAASLDPATALRQG